MENNETNNFSFGTSNPFDYWLKKKDNPVTYCLLTMDGKNFLAKNSYEIELTQKTADHDTFTIAVPDDALDSFDGYVMENSKNLLGKNITITFHRYGEVRQTFAGIIGNITDKKDNGSGYGDLYITGYSPSILLENGKDCQSFEDKTLEQIIKDLTEGYPQEAKITISSNYLNEANTKSLPYTVQYKESDYQFIRRLAVRHGEFFYYNGENLVFGNKVESIIKLGQGIDLMSVEFEMKIGAQNFMYLGYDVHSGSQIEKDSQNIRSEFKESPFQSIAVNSSDKIFRKKSKMHFNHTGISSNSERELEEAVRLEKERRENLMVVRGKSRDPELRIGGRTELRDINAKAMETYRITEIKHYHSGNNYYNEFVGIPDFFNAAPYIDIEAVPLGEAQPARVLDNNDPMGMGRVRVQFPWQEEKNQMTPWIRTTTIYAGAGRGDYKIPEIGDEVLISHKSGNAEQPYVSGALYDGVETSGFHTSNNDLKVERTRSGVEEFINDAEGSWKQSTPDGNYFLQDGKGNAIMNVPNNLTFNIGGNFNVNVGKNLSFLVGMRAIYNIGIQMIMNTPFLKYFISDNYHLQSHKTLINGNGKIKIEAKETNVAGFKKMFIHSNEVATINSNGTIEVKGESGTSNSNIAEERPPATTETIKDCIVEFRPRIPNYGKFGFDFMRIGDNTGNGVYDTTYLANMGTYAQNDSNNTFTADASPYNKFKGLVTGEFNPVPISVAEFKKTDIKEQYAVPWLSLYRIPVGRLLADGTPDPEADSCIAATLKLLIEVKIEPDELRLEFDDRYFTITGGGGSTTKAEVAKPNSSYFSIPSKTVTVTGGTAGAPHNMDIEINCIKEFPSPLSIKAFAVTKDATTNITTENLAGKLLIKPNNKANRKYQKIVLVNVQTALDGTTPNRTASNGQEDVLKNALRQALIDPRIKKENLACTDASFNSYLHTLPTPAGSTAPASKVIKGYYEYDYAHSRANTHKPRVWKDIEDYLNEKLHRIKPEYRSYIKVYYFDSVGGYIKTNGSFDNLNGYSTTGQKTTVLFKGYDANATTAHEVLHSMGLDHTFESKNIIPTGRTTTNAPNGKYTFKFHSTDNFLDYSHYSPYVTRKSLMEWQWEILRRPGGTTQPEP